jgi:hypothetical protein
MRSVSDEEFPIKRRKRDIEKERGREEERENVT